MRYAIVTLAILIAGSLNTTAKGYVVINDGDTHIINYDYFPATVENDIWVDYETPGVGTHLSLVDGGNIDGDLWADEDSVITVSGGRIRSTLQGAGNSQVTLSGGIVDNYVAAMGNAYMTISGGTIIDYVWAVDNSRVYISGGSFGNPLYIHENSQVTLQGSNFAINSIPVGYGQYSAADFASGRITGSLAKGNLINNDFYITDDATLVLVPEPTALFLITFGALALRRKKREGKGSEMLC